MFTDNKYKKWYDSIIKNSRNRTLEGYTEKHHVIPKSLGGDNSPENIVKLTAREHFICHLLLTKFVTETFLNKKMLNALGKFVQKNKHQKRVLNSRQYDFVRTAISKANKGRVYSLESREKISKSNKGRVPWNKGKAGVQTYPEVAKEKLKSIYKNKSFSERYGEEKAKEVKKQISETKKGKPSGMLGKTHSLETRELMSRNMRKPRGPQKRIDICPSCSEQNVTARHIKFCSNG